MKALVLLAVVATAAPTGAHAEPLPPGALEVFGGAISGTGEDAKRLGFGYQIGAGVGLGVARSVATTLGGQVTLATRHGGGGAVITMWLPVAPVSG